MREFYLVPCDMDNLPQSPCVYVVMDKDSVIYVGQTRNMRRRWAAHNKLKSSYSRLNLMLIPADERDLSELERRAILALNPVLNTNLPKGKKNIRDCSKITTIPIPYGTPYSEVWDLVERALARPA